jgi:hypothetical protein
MDSVLTMRISSWIWQYFKQKSSNSLDVYIWSLTYMEFKKHFSTNLQNLSVKKTLILNPPPGNADPSLRPSPGRCHNK